MKVLKYITAIVLLPIYLAFLLLVGFALGFVEGLELTVKTFDEITL